MWIAVLPLSIPALGGTASIRPDLTDDEWIAIGVSSADAVVTAEVEGIRDSAVTQSIGLGGGKARTLRTFVDIRVSEVLKGDSLGTDLMVTVPSFGPSRKDLAFLGRGSDRRGIFFLQRRGSAWVIASETAPSAGVIALRGAEAKAVGSRIRSLAASQSLEILASEAMAVVIGELHGRTSCTKPPGEADCLLFRVDATIKGAGVPSDIRVYCPVLPELSFGKAVLFLRQVEGGKYALVGSHAGIIPTHDRLGRPLRADLTDLYARIRSSAVRGPEIRE